MNVLLVEDNRLNQELARDLLEAAGHHVEVADDGKAFLAQLAAGAQPDIVLMDMLLPDSDGVTLLGRLRATPTVAATPVLAVTAQALAGDLERFLAAGFDAVITKPIDTRTFVDTVERRAGGAKR